MTLVWPDELPSTSLRQAFGLTFGEARAMPQASSGGMLPRLRYSQVPDSVTVAFDMTHAQYEAYRAFWRDDCRRGVLPFLIRDQLADGLPLLTPDGEPLLTPAGEPLLRSAWWLARIGREPPAITVPYGTTRAVTVPLWILP